MSQRLEKAIKCLADTLSEQLEALCDKLEAERTLTPIVGDACCVLIDGVPAYASPVRVFNGEEQTLSESVQWVDPDTLAPITGTVEPADPCDCPCLECEEAEGEVVGETFDVVESATNGASVRGTLNTAGALTVGDSVVFLDAAGAVKAKAKISVVEGQVFQADGLSPEGLELDGCKLQVV